MKNMTMIGTIIMNVAAAFISPQYTPCSVIKPPTATGSVGARDRERMRAKRKSFQDPVKAIIEVATSPALDTGSMILYSDNEEVHFRIIEGEEFSP